MSNTYISSDTIRFDKDFIFTFDVIGETHRDFEIEFKVRGGISNEFLISNNLDADYTLESDESDNTPSFSVVKKSVSTNINSEISFFDDKLIIHEGKVYKNFNKESRDGITGFYRKNDKLYIKSDLYSFDGNYIIRKNPKLEENIYLRPVIVKKTFGNTSLSSYFGDINNPINSNITKTYRIIVSDNACLISFLVKEKDSFKVIKNFTYPTTQEISEGKISLKVDKNMILNNLHFSFFKA